MAGKNLYYPSNLTDTNAHPAWIQFNFFKRKSPSGADASEKDDVIHLYMPEQTSQPSTVSWTNENFGFLGNQLATGARTFKDLPIMDALMDVGSQTMQGAASAGDLIVTRALANAGSAAASFMGGNVSAEGLMGEVLGKVPNPYLTAVFQGVNFRNFAFAFKFYPFSESDCDRIDEIIKTFRAHSLPKYKSNDAFLGYPSECQISYKWQGKDNKYLHKFKRAVCTGIDVDYTAQGMFSVMRNGFPSEITVATKWSELEIVTRDDIEEGF